MNKSVDLAQLRLRAPTNEKELPAEGVVGKRLTLAQRILTARVVSGLQFFFDVCAVMAAIVVADHYRPLQMVDVFPVLAVLAFAGVNLVSFRHFGFYRVDSIVRGVAFDRRFLAIVVTNSAIAAGLALAVPETLPPEAAWLALVVAVSMGGILILRMLFSALIRAGLCKEVLGENVVLVGDGSAAQKFVRCVQARHPRSWWRLVGVVDDRGPTERPRALANLPWLGKSDEISRLVRHEYVQHVVISLPWNAELHFDELRRELARLPVAVSLTWDWEPPVTEGSPLARFMPEARWGDYEVPMHPFNNPPAFGWGAVIKWIEDKTLASVGLLLLSPLLLLIAVLIKLDSPGPVFFRQKRYGFNHRPIMVYKFRTMFHDESAAKRFRQATKNDRRITRLGRFLRRTSLDELPQLFNVIDGSMSLVGPRPHPVELEDHFSRLVEGLECRHNVKPGITGWAQINGFRGETDTLEKMQARIAYDIYYIENWSLWFDIKILTKTVIRGWSGENAY